jgi:phosphatidylglycerophosphate synthase
LSDKPYTPERRPIASRELAVWKHTAAWLARMGVSPNAISLSGMACGLAAGGAFALTSLPAWERAGFLAAALLIQLRLLANMLDGMVALQSGKGSPVGELYNEIPDRVSDAAILIGAGYAAGSLPELGYLAACMALFVAYMRAEGKAAGAHQEFCGPMAKSHRMFTLTVVAVYCGLAPQAWQPTLSVPRPAGLVAAALLLVVVGGAVTALRRLVRIARTLRKGAA